MLSALDGGGPDGVVDTLLRKLRDLSGVDGESMLNGSNDVLKLILNYANKSGENVSV